MVRRLAARLQRLAPVQSQVAVLLSGGLDSTTLFRTAQNLFGIAESYSTGFPFKQDGEDVERQYAESAAAALGAGHHYFQSSAGDYVRGVLSAIAATEEPVHHLQSVLLYLLFERGLPAEKTVVVSGEGADGIFGVEMQRSCWRREHKTALFTLLSRFPSTAAIRWLVAQTGRGSGFFEPVVNPAPGKDYENPEHELWSVGAYGSKRRVIEQFGCHEDDLFRSRLALVNRIRDRSIYDVISLLSLGGEGTITQIIWNKLGEACGRFVDYPFLDPDLLWFAYRTSWEAKLREPKWLVRAVLRCLKVPEFIIRRPKSSFGLNRRGWALKGDILEPLVPLAAKVFPEREIRNVQTEDGSEASTFWALLNYALWKRLCVDGEPLESLQEELDWQTRDAASVHFQSNSESNLSLTAPVPAAKANF
jgi:asparagine synthetase B (glutamine-hydrolysing)